MSNEVQPIPEGYHSLTPYLVVRNADRAIDFYRRAFGAEEVLRMPSPDGKVMHAEVQIGSSRLMLCDENPENEVRSPESLGGAGASVLLYVERVDEVFERAVSAGATAKMPVSDMFWGDRYGKVTDPFGHDWSIATHVEDLTPEEIGQRAQELFARA